eukprot:125573_1
MSQPCRFFNTVNGCRYGSSCHFSHGLAPTDESSLCRYFNSATGCRYGSRCHFKHETKTEDNDDNPSDVTDDEQTEQKQMTTNNARSTNNIEQKIKTLKACMSESSSIEPIEKYSEFYAPLRFDHEPISMYVPYGRTMHAEALKEEGNQMYANKQYMEAIRCYQNAVRLLDCTHLNHKYDDDLAKYQSTASWGASPEKKRNELLFVLLSNTAQCWLSHAESVRAANKKSEKEKYILYILYALNNAQMSLWINDSRTNVKALYRQAVCMYRLGLFDYADTLTKDNKMMHDMTHKLQKEKLRHKTVNKQIQKYSKLMQKLGNASELSDLEGNMNACNVQYLLLSISQLVLTKQWSMSGCMSWLKRFVHGMRRMYHDHAIPSDVFTNSEVNPFKSYCFSIIMTALSIKPAQIATLFDGYIGYKSADEWEDLANEIKYIQMETKSMWFCEQFWSVLVDNVLNIKQYDNDTQEAVRKETLLYVMFRNADKRNRKWNAFYNQHAHNQSSNSLPSDGRLKPLPKYNFKDGNSMELGSDDLLNIHALATYQHLHDVFGDSVDSQTIGVLEPSRQQSKVIQEIEQVMPYCFYHMGFTWLHEFARNGCFDACEFVISMGMDVNVIDRVKHDRKRQYYYSDPVTPIDYVLKMLKEDHLYFASGRDRKQRLEMVVLTLRKSGGKRYCELKNTKGDYKETKIFEKILNGSLSMCNVNAEGDRSDSEDEEYGYNGIPQHMCDELLCQGIKPWDDIAMDALSVLYDFD